MLMHRQPSPHITKFTVLPIVRNSPSVGTTRGGAKPQNSHQRNIQKANMAREASSLSSQRPITLPPGFGRPPCGVTGGTGAPEGGGGWSVMRRLHGLRRVLVGLQGYVMVFQRPF